MITAVYDVVYYHTTHRLSAGAHPFCVDHEGRTALHVAARCGARAAAQLLLRFRSEQGESDYDDQQGEIDDRRGEIADQISIQPQQQQAERLRQAPHDPNTTSMVLGRNSKGSLARSRGGERREMQDQELKTAGSPSYLRSRRRRRLQEVQDCNGCTALEVARQAGHAALMEDLLV